jgi:hypothetical protein
MTDLPRCGNDAHRADPPPAATVRITWPGGQHAPITACGPCAIEAVETWVICDFEIGAPHRVLIEPMAAGDPDEPPGYQHPDEVDADEWTMWAGDGEYVSEAW